MTALLEKSPAQIELDKLCDDVNALRRIYGYCHNTMIACQEQLEFLESAHSKDEGQKEYCRNSISYLKEKMSGYTVAINQRQPRIDQLVHVIFGG